VEAAPKSLGADAAAAAVRYPTGERIEVVTAATENTITAAGRTFWVIIWAYIIII